MADPAGLDRATFVFTDIVDSTLLWETYPAEMAEALARHDELVADAVARQRGSLLKSKGEGDSTVSVFAAASGAVLAAVEIQRALGSEPWPDGAAVRVRIGIHTGDTHRRAGEYFGPTLNRGARLRAFAAPGEIAVSQATLDEVGSDSVDTSLSFVDLGPHALRGLVRPEHIYLVAGPGLQSTSAAAREWVSFPMPAALEPTARPVLVGRDAEVGELRAAFEDAAAGTRRLALIGGEPGVGKTALAGEVATGAHAEGAVVLFGRCDEDLHAPYQPFIEALRQYVESCPAPLLGRQLGGVGADLARLLPVLSDLLPDVAPPLAAAAPEPQQRMFEAVDAFVTAIAQARPVVLVLDDLHWATAPTLALLRHLLHSPAKASLLVITTYRDADLARGVPLRDGLGDLHRLPHVNAISLRPLAQAEIAELVESITDTKDVSAEVARVLHARTAGNAFYVTELVHHLVACGVLEVGASPDDLQRRIDAAGLPAGVRAVVRQRLSGLSEQAEHTLAAAAVLGAEFSFADLERALPDDLPAVIDSVDEAIAARLLVESGADRFAFAHSLVRDTLYDELSPMRRMTLHRSIGEVLETVGDRRERVPEMAFHFSRALALSGSAAKAVDYALIAGASALAAYAFDDAVSIYDRGLAAYETLTTPDPRVRALLLLGRARAHQSRGAPAAMRADALAAVAEARSCGDGRLLAVASMYLGWLPVGDREGHHQACLDALALLGDDAPAFRAIAYNGLANEELQVGSVARCLEFVTDALALVRQTADTAALISTLGMYATALIWSQRPEERAQCAEELITLEDGEWTGLPVAAITGVSLLDTTGASRALSSEHMWAVPETTFVEKPGRRLRALVRFADGDLPGFAEDVAAIEQHAQATGSRIATYMVAAWRAVEALLQGRFDEAAAQEDVILPFTSEYQAASCLFEVRAYRLRELGRLDEFLPIVEALANATAFNAMLALGVEALAAIEGGDAARGRELLGKVTPDVLASALDSLGCYQTGALILEVSALLDDDRFGDALANAFAPTAGRLVPGTSCGISSIGAGDRMLAIIASLRRDWATAERLFASALELERSLPSPTLVARSEYWYARMLRGRDADGDAARAAELAAAATATAQRIGQIELLGLLESLD